MSSMAEERKRRRPRRSFTDEFKASAVQRVLEGGKTIPQVARDLDLTESALRGWVEQARADAGKGKLGALTNAEREELTRLRKENRAADGPGDPKESRGLLREREALRFGFINEDRGLDADEPRPWELQVEDQAQSLGIEKLSRSPVVSSSSRTAGWSQVGSRAVAPLEGPGRDLKTRRTEPRDVPARA